MIAWNSVNFLNLAGLIYDIAGAVMLARAVILNPKQKIAQQVATAWGYNKHMIPAVVEGKLEGRQADVGHRAHQGQPGHDKHPEESHGERVGQDVGHPPPAG